MPFLVGCPACQSTFDAPDHVEGRNMKCPNCHAVISVPFREETAAAPVREETDAASASADVDEYSPRPALSPTVKMGLIVAASVLLIGGGFVVLILLTHQQEPSETAKQLAGHPGNRRQSGGELPEEKTLPRSERPTKNEDKNETKVKKHESNPFPELPRIHKDQPSDAKESDTKESIGAELGSNHPGEPKAPPLDPKLAALGKRLNTSSGADPGKAIEEIAKLGEEAIPLAHALCALTLDRSPKVAEAALAALKKVQPAIGQPVSNLLNWNDPQKHLEAYQSLSALKENAFGAEPVIWAELKKLQTGIGLPSQLRADLLQANVTVLATIAVRNAETFKHLSTRVADKNQTKEVREVILLALADAAAEDAAARTKIAALVGTALKEPAMELVCLESAGKLRAEGKLLVPALKGVRDKADGSLKEAATEALDLIEENGKPKGVNSARRLRCEKSALEWLARMQKPDGSWATGMGGSEPPIVVTTSLAGLALMSGGKQYQTNVEAAAKYVNDHLFIKSLPPGAPANVDQSNWKLGIGGLFLCEFYGTMKKRDPKFKAPGLAKNLDLLAGEIIDRMEKSGGWGHMPRLKNPLNYVELEVMSNWMLTTLGALQRLGFDVPDDGVTKATKFIENCCEDGKGGVGYSPNSGQKGIGCPCRTGGAIAAIAVLNKQGSPLFPKMIENWKGTMANSNEGHGSLALGFLASAMGARQVGDEEWRDFRNRFFEQILSHARCDGSFRYITGQSPQAQGNADKQVGAAYTTAIYQMILQMDRNNLTFLGQRFEEKRKDK